MARPLVAVIRPNFDRNLINADSLGFIDLLNYNLAFDNNIPAINEGDNKYGTVHAYDTVRRHVTHRIDAQSKKKISLVRYAKLRR